MVDINSSTRSSIKLDVFFQGKKTLKLSDYYGNLSSPIKRNATENAISMDGVSYISLISIANHDSSTWIKMLCLGGLFLAKSHWELWVWEGVIQPMAKWWFMMMVVVLCYCQCLWNPTPSYIYTPTKHRSTKRSLQTQFICLKHYLHYMFCNKTSPSAHLKSGIRQQYVLYFSLS